MAHHPRAPTPRATYGSTLPDVAKAAVPIALHGGDDAGAGGGEITLELEYFETFTATPEIALLRLAGRWRANEPTQLSAAVLLVDDGLQLHRLAALLSPDDSRPFAAAHMPRWRAAFAVPAALLTDPTVTIALDAGLGGPIKLPGPVARSLGRATREKVGLEPPRGSVGRLAARGGALLVARNGVVQTLQVASSLVLARLISPEDYGSFAIALIAIGFARYQGDLGVTNSLLARKQLGDGVIETAGFVACAASSIAALALILTAPLLNVALGGSGRTTLLIQVLAIGLVVESLRIPPTLLAQRALRFDVLAITALIETIALYVVQVLLLVVGLGLWALVAAQLARAFAGTAVLAVKGGGLVRPAPRVPVIPLIRQALPFQATAAMTGLSGLLLPVLISAVLSTRGFGYWAWATVLAAPLITLSNVVQSVALPALAKLRREESPSLARATGLMMRAVVVPASLGAGLLTGLAGPIVVHVYGNQWVAATGAVRANLAGVVALTFTALLSAVIESERRATARATSALCSIVVGSIVIIPLTLWSHTTGAALGSGLVAPVVDALGLWWLTRTPIEQPLLRSLAAFGIMTGLGLTVSPLVTSLAALLFTLGFGAVIAAGVAALIDIEALRFVLRSLGVPEITAKVRARLRLSLTLPASRGIPTDGD